MIILITGATHSGKTALAQKLLEKYRFPYLSIDHLKMGLIRSGNTALTPESDDGALTAYLWPIVREIIKTAVENGQNLIVEGCYVPFTWNDDFDERYAAHIEHVCVILSERYIKTHFEDITAHANDAETRLDDSGLTQDLLLSDNAHNLEMCEKNGLDFVLIHDEYENELERGVSRILSKS